MKRMFMFIFALSIVFGLSAIAHAMLWDRGGGLIYDDVLKVTWLQDANLAATQTFGVPGINSNGTMSWSTAGEWVAAMNADKYLGYSGWRLPTTVDGPYVWGYDGNTTAGYNTTTSEMGYMYYVNLGNEGYYAKDGTNPLGWGLTNTSFESGGPGGPTVSFQNLQPYFYWSGTKYSFYPGYAWLFAFGYGLQSPGVTDGIIYAWAVHNGDVGDPVAHAPVPATLFLLGGGLSGLAALRIKRNKSI